MVFIVNVFNLYEKYYDMFEGYLKVMNYKLTTDEVLGVIYLENDYGYNKLRLDKLTTLVLFTLRTVYDEEKAEIVRYFFPPAAENATPNGEKVVLNPEKLKIKPKIKFKNVIKISRLLSLNFFSLFT